jgi:hypothetical protein
MKMYPDLTVEGTPEEVAAFKHIDAALAARKRPSMKAIESSKPEKKPPPKKVPKAPPTSDLAEQIINLARAKDGVTALEVAEYFEMDKKTAYNRLYHMQAKGLMWRTDHGLFKAHAHAAVSG